MTLESSGTVCSSAAGPARSVELLLFAPARISTTSQAHAAVKPRQLTSWIGEWVRTVRRGYRRARRLIARLDEADRRGVPLAQVPQRTPGAPRTETGVVQIDGDWPGVFIRGDQAMRHAITLRCAAAMLDAPSRVYADELRRIARFLETCDTKRLDPRSTTQLTRRP